MPSQFSPFRFSLSRAEADLTSFKAWFETQSFLGEKSVVSELRARPQMCALLAAAGSIPAPDLLKFELALQGLFRTDLVIGNNSARRFALIEFEDAEVDSIFSGGTAQYRHWSRRLERGIGQVVDWAWLRSDDPHASVLTNAFGGAINYSAYFVICGRDAGIVDEIERRRFEFRRNSVSIEGIPLRILTYDGMVTTIEEQLEIGKSFALAT